MKKLLFILVSFIFIFSSCSSNDNDEPPQTFTIVWHLTNVTGGIAGVNELFDPNIIVWAFDETTLMLTITNNNTDDAIEDGLDSGTYNYSVINIDEDSFLIIDGNEFGGFILTESALQINSNETSNGPATDGYIYTFIREIVAVD